VSVSQSPLSVKLIESVVALSQDSCLIKTCGYRQYLETAHLMGAALMAPSASPPQEVLEDSALGGPNQYKIQDLSIIPMIV